MMVQTVFHDTVQIPSLPAIAVMILDAVQDEDASLERLAHLVSSDPALTAKVLKAANSSLYGLRTKVATINQAIALLGLNALKNIALSFVIVDSLQGVGDGRFDFTLFWKRAVTGAVAANIIAMHLRQKHDEAFVCGMLQDIGILVLYLSKQVDYSRIFDEKNITKVPIVTLEQNSLGCDHQEVGAMVLTRWGFPPSIVEPIRFHHRTEQVPEEYRVQAQIVQLADRISAVYHGASTALALQTVKDLFRKCFAVEEGDAQVLIDTVAQESNEVLSHFELGANHLKPVSQLLQEANEELAKLSFTSEQLALHYKKEQEKAANLAQELKAANEHLKAMAFRDSLTGLFNQRHFLTALEYEFKRGIRYQRPFSLVLLDVDQFKRINDEFGHRSGDILLKVMATTLIKGSRSTDLLARYGGDEFAIICPETGMHAAGVMVERIRTEIERLIIPMGGKTVRVTISAGIAEYVPGCALKAGSELFDLADQALYQSKGNGRNRVSMFPPASRAMSRNRR